MVGTRTTSQCLLTIFTEFHQEDTDILDNCCIVLVNTVGRGNVGKTRLFLAIRALIGQYLEGALL